MLKHPLYVYGGKEMQVPANLHFGEYILEKMHENRQKVALINGSTGDSITYGQIAQEGMNLAVSLSHIGLKKGQRVAICSENRVEFWSVVVGVACTGGILTTLNPIYTESEIKHAMNISKPSYVVLSPFTYKIHGKLFKSLPHIKGIILFGQEKQNNVMPYSELAVSNNGNGSIIVNNRLARNVNYEEFEAVSVDGQSDILFILYSSGTTGVAKGVMLTHLNVIAQCCMSSALDATRISITITPWFHTMGLVGTLTGLRTGRTSVFLPKFDVDLFLSTIEKYKVVQVTLVPPIVVAVSKVTKQYDLSSVELIYSGAAPLYKETSDLLKNKFPNLKGVYQGYGMTESALAITRFTFNDMYTLGATKQGSVGKALDGATIKIVDLKTRKPLGPNQPGEICVKGILIMKGYVGKDRKEDFDDEGFFRTGDVGYYDDDKCFFIVDRLKELIKYKGYQVAPAELEALLLEHEGVRDAGVIGIPDRSAGEVPLAFIVKQPEKNVTEKELQDFVAGKLSNPKWLRGGVRFIDAIPKNPSGKILRKNLRQLVKSNKSKL